jgi:hypothetical protein
VGAGARGDRARRAAIAEAAGASTGGVGLIAFAVVAWLGLPHLPAPLALGAAAIAWAAAGFGTWAVRRVLAIR